MAEYSCKWNSHATNMLNVMDNLKGVENFVDVTLISEGRALKAHKLVLSTSSQFFHQAFLANPCSHPIVVMADIKFSTLKTIVDYIYKGEVRFLEGELEPLLKAAKVLEIKGLMDISKEKLVSQQQTHSEGGGQPTGQQQQQAVVLRSPRRKRPRPPSGEARQYDDHAKEGEVLSMEIVPRVGGSGGDSNSENGEQDDDGHAKPQGEEANIRIKQALRSLCSAKRMTLKEKQKITGDPLDRRTSFVWNFFTPIDNVFACCKTCKKNISRKSSISNLKKHLENKHSEIVLQSYSSLAGPENPKEHEESTEEIEPAQRQDHSTLEDQEVAQAVCTIDAVVAAANATTPFEGAQQVYYIHEDVHESKNQPYVVKFTTA